MNPTYIADVIDRVGTNFIEGIVFKAYTGLAIDGLNTFYYMALIAVGWAVLHFAIAPREYTVQKFVKSTIIIAIAWYTLRHYDFFVTIIFDSVAKIPFEIAGSITNALTQGSSLSKPYAALDELLWYSLSIVQRLFSMGSFFGEDIVYIVLAVIYGLLAGVAIAYAVVYILVVQVLLAVMLIIAPLPIALSIYDWTRGVFFAWLKILGGLAFMPLLIAALLVLMMSIIGTDIKDAATAGEDLQLTDIALASIIMFISFKVFQKVMDKADALGSGIVRESYHDFKSGLNAMRRKRRVA